MAEFRPGSVELKHCAIQSNDFTIHSAGLAREAPETVQFDAGTTITKANISTQQLTGP